MDGNDNKNGNGKIYFVIYSYHPKLAHEPTKVVQEGERRQWEPYGHQRAWTCGLMGIYQLTLCVSQHKLGKAVRSAGQRS